MSRVTYAAVTWRWCASSTECNFVQIFLEVKSWGKMTGAISIVDVLNAVDFNPFKKTEIVA